MKKLVHDIAHKLQWYNQANMKQAAYILFALLVTSKWSRLFFFLSFYVEVGIWITAGAEKYIGTAPYQTFLHYQCCESWQYYDKKSDIMWRTRTHTRAHTHIPVSINIHNDVIVRSYRTVALFHSRHAGNPHNAWSNNGISVSPLNNYFSSAYEG